MADENELLANGYLDMNQAAALLRLGSAERVRQLIREGWIKKAERGTVFWRDAVWGRFDWYEDRLKTAMQQSSSNKVRDARTREIELRTAQRAGTLVPLVDVIATFDVIFGTLRAEAEGLPARISRDREIRNRAQDGINGMFDRASAAIAALRQQGTSVAGELGAPDRVLAGSP